MCYCAGADLGGSRSDDVGLRKGSEQLGSAVIRRLWCGLADPSSCPSDVDYHAEFDRCWSDGTSERAEIRWKIGPLLSRFLMVIQGHSDLTRINRVSWLGDLAVPRSRTAIYGQRSFSVCGPSLWNSLPLSVRDPSLTMTQFWRLFCFAEHIVLSIALSWQFRL